ncbi:peptide deformylase [Spirosoma utsteinense]|uniref:Peptide deformylase n=1 Tax=Spirosoma utsteinense TaxID=2585773 RepID=A0ABR6WAE7_9BACT|nr:peptide deformylase [Spirosoma utsteinense]MBC3787226.1 peptide deformylase [Spirosoma utsteinense]MBC3792912.1 peptide deformylase [Spirosoma utsteinense]
MKHLADLLLLGDPRLYETCDPVLESELPLVPGWVADLHNVMEEIRARYQFGRGIAAPQLGIMKRLIYLNVDRPVVIINPAFVTVSPEIDELWDDCMSFPNLLVRVQRHRSLTMTFRDEHWQLHTWDVTDWSLSELIQHEYDHLNGVLCTMRAVDGQSLRWRPTPASTDGLPAQL